MKYIAVLFSVCLPCVAPAGPRPLAGSKPNIILVMTDDQGMGDLSCMGNQVVRTPHIDRFHKQSTRFTDFQVSPTCAPTRAAIMSVRPPFKAGVTHTIMQRERMAPAVHTMPQALQSAGHETGIFGKADKWSDWSEIKESYDYTPGFSKQVRQIPAKLDLSGLPDGFGFQIEMKITDSTENESKPIIEHVELSFK